MIDKIDHSLESQKENIIFDPALGWSVETKNKVKNLVRSYYSFYKLGEPKIDFKSMEQEENKLLHNGGVSSTLAYTEGLSIYCSSQLRLYNSEFENTLTHELGHTIGGDHKKDITPILVSNDGVTTDTLKSFKRFNVTVGRGDGGGDANIAVFEESAVERLAIQYAGYFKKKYEVSSPMYFYRGNIMESLTKEKKGFNVSKILSFKKTSDLFGLLTYLFERNITSENIHLIIGAVSKWRKNVYETQDAQGIINLSKNAIKEARNNLARGSLAE